MLRREAYALADRGGDKFSGEVIRTLLTEVESFALDRVRDCLRRFQVCKRITPEGEMRRVSRKD